MNFGGHQSFALRDQWIFKGLNALEEYGDIFKTNERAIEKLGVGSNMVSSIRYWLLATKVAKIGEGSTEISKFGKLLFKYDQYFERVGTSWLLHYGLSTNKERATAWFWFFNKFGVTEFDVESAAHYFAQYVGREGRKVKDSTLHKDLQTLLRMYVRPNYAAKETPEVNLICPLSQLGLIESGQGKMFFVKSPEIDDIPIEIFSYCLIDFWKTELGRVPEFAFEELINKDNSPGKIFCLNSDKLVDLLDRVIEGYPEIFSYHRSGGYFNVKIVSARSASLLNSYYGV